MGDRVVEILGVGLRTAQMLAHCQVFGEKYFSNPAMRVSLRTLNSLPMWPAHCGRSALSFLKKLQTGQVFVCAKRVISPSPFVTQNALKGPALDAYTARCGIMRGKNKKRGANPFFYLGVAHGAADT